MSVALATTPPKRNGAGFNRGQSKQNYATPPDFIAAVTKRFGPLNFDLAAEESNRKHENFFSIRDNSLVQEWHKIPGNLWLNPPFDNIGPWAQKCASEAVLGATILFLVPASVGSNWFRDFVYERCAVLFLNGRIHFDPANPTWGYPKDCLLGCYSPKFRPRSGHAFDIWTWK